MDSDKYSNQKRLIRKTHTSKKETHVYGLIDPRDGGLFWVGMTNAPQLRYDQHVFSIGERNRKKQGLVDSIVKAGLKPGMVLIEKFKTREEAADLEKSLIGFLSTVSSIKLANIEHVSEETWSFKKTVRPERSGNTWTADERGVLICSYKKGIIVELIAKEISRGRLSVLIELYRVHKAEFLTLRPEDVTIVTDAWEKRKYRVPAAYSDEEKTQISSLLPKVTSRYGDLNAEHMKFTFMNTKQREKNAQSA